ncbi:MAG: dynamin family protein [Acidobacteriota bacterium]
MSERARVFLSYSHQDEDLKKELVDHLSVLRHRGIELWLDDHLEAGEVWKERLMEQIDQTTVAVLLITEQFLSSPFILDEELPALVERAEAGELTLFPIIGRHCAWRSVPWLSRLQVRPKNGTPVWRGDDHETDRILASLAEEITEIVDRPRPAEDGVVHTDSAMGRAVWYHARALHDELETILERLQDELERERYVAVIGTDTANRWQRGFEQVRERATTDFTIAIIGHFKRGKSTLVNALLGHDVATTDVTPETVTCNEIRFGERLTVEACLASGGRVSLRPEELRRSELETILAELPEPVDHLDITSPTAWLEGMCLVDTPGTGDLFVRFDDQVRDYLARADAVLYLLSPLEPVSESERNFLELAVMPQDFAKVVFVVNMLDKIRDANDERQILELIRRRVAKLLPEAHIFGVSAADEMARQAGETRPRPERGQTLAAGFDALRAHLHESIVKNRDVIQLERAIGDAAALLDEIDASVTTLAASFGSDPAQVDARLADYENERSPLNRTIDDTFTEVENAIAAMAREASGWLAGFSDRLASSFDQLDDHPVSDLQRHFPFFLSDALRAALTSCVDAHRPAILALSRHSRARLSNTIRDLTSSDAVHRALDDTASQATFGQELWMEFDTADYLSQLLGSELFRFGADILRRDETKDQKKIALFQRKLTRSLPQIRDRLQEQARTLYDSFAQHILGELAEQRRELLTTSRLALERAHTLSRRSPELDVVDTLDAIHRHIADSREQLGALHAKLGTRIDMEAA